MVGLHRDKRPLSYIEEYFFWKSHLRYYSNYHILAELKDEVSAENLYYALQAMVTKHSALSMTLMPDATDKNGYQLVFTDKIKFSDVAEFLDLPEEEATPDQLLEKIYDSTFEHGSNTPLWGLKIINKKYVMYYTDHIIYDGTSGKNFHIELAKELKNIESNKLNALFKFDNLESLIFDRSTVDLTNYQIIPDHTKFIGFDKPWWKRILKVFYVIAPDWFSNWVYYWFAGNPFSKFLKFKKKSFNDCKIDSKAKISTPRSINLETAKVKKLLQICRSHNVKLTSLIAVVSHLAYNEFIKSDEHDAEYSIPINVRDQINKPKAIDLCTNFDDLFGTYIACAMVKVPEISKICPDGRVNWKLVEFIHDSLHNYTDEALNDMSLIQKIDPKKFIIDKYTQNHFSTIEISNLGVINDETGLILNAWFDQACELFGCNMISTSNSLSLVLRSLNEEWVDKYKENMLSILNDLLENN